MTALFDYSDSPAQSRSLTTAAQLKIGARRLKFGIGLHLFPYFEETSNEVSSEPWLLAHMMSTYVPKSPILVAGISSRRGIVE